MLLKKNVEDYQKFLEIYKDCAPEWKDYYKRMLKSYNVSKIDVKNIKELKQLTKAAKLINAKPFFEEKRKDRNTKKLGMLINTFIQVNDAYQNLDNKSYKDGFHSKKMLALQVTNDNYLYNTKLLKRYGLSVPSCG